MYKLFLRAPLVNNISQACDPGRAILIGGVPAVRRKGQGHRRAQGSPLPGERPPTGRPHVRLRLPMPVRMHLRVRLPLLLPRGLANHNL